MYHNNYHQKLRPLVLFPQHENSTFTLLLRNVVKWLDTL